MNRRQFLTAGGALGLAAAASYFALQPQDNTPKPSYTRLATDGLPKELDDLGLTIGKVTNKGTPQEVAFISERHNFPDLGKKKSRIINALIKNYGADSLGLENIFGDPKPDLEETYVREMQEIFKPLDPTGEYLTLARMDDAIKPYARQESIPCYGIEDKKQLAWGIPADSMHGNMGVLGKALVRHRYEDIAYLQSVRWLERMYDYARKQYPEAPLRENTLKEFLMPGGRSHPRNAQKLYDYMIEHAIGGRNKTFARNIPRIMSTLDSTRGVVVIGSAHFDRYEDSSNTQDLLPYTSVIIRGLDRD